MGLLNLFNKNSNTSSTTSKKQVEEKQIQRREFVRADKCCPITCHISDRNGNSIEGDFPCETINISGGGVKILTEKGLFRLGDILDCSLSIENKEILFAMKVVRSDDAKCTLKTYGCQFTTISDFQRDCLIKLVFEELLKQRKTLGSLTSDNRLL